MSLILQDIGHGKHVPLAYDLLAELFGEGHTIGRKSRTSSGWNWRDKAYGLVGRNERTLDEFIVSNCRWTAIGVVEGDGIQIAFKSKDDAMLFKLTWSHGEQ